MTYTRLWAVMSAKKPYLFSASPIEVTSDMLGGYDAEFPEFAPFKAVEYVSTVESDSLILAEVGKRREVELELESLKGTQNMQNSLGVRILAFPGLKDRSPGFLDRLITVAKDVEVDPNHLLTIMQLESGINPQAKNPNGGATGLIQFMPATAKWLQTSTEALYAMSDVHQLDYVRKYFMPFHGRIKSPGDCYMAVFYPAYIGRPDETIISRKGQTIYESNKVLDVDHNGVLTVGDVKRKAETYYKSLTGKS